MIRYEGRKYHPSSSMDFKLHAAETDKKWTFECPYCYCYFLWTRTIVFFSRIKNESCSYRREPNKEILDMQKQLMTND